MRAVIYARYSPGSDQTELSIEGQVRECKRYIEQKGYDLQHIYADRHVTGLSTKNRDEFASLIADARARKFDIVICYDTARFARDKFDAVVYKHELREKLHIGIEYATMSVEGPEGRLLESIMEGWNQYFSEELSRKTKRGMTEAQLKGRAVGSHPPLGYRFDENKMHVIDESTAAAVREVFNDYAAGCTMAACARKLNAQGCRTAQGRPFGANSTKYLLTNKKYIGIYANTPGLIPPIVSPEVFYAVQKRFKSAPRPKSISQGYPLVGKLVCGCCGTLMTGTSGTSRTKERYYYYQCPKKCENQRLRRDKLDDFVVRCARETLSAPETVKRIAARLFDYQKKENAKETKTETLRKSLNKVNRSIDNLTLAIAERPASAALLSKLDDLEQQREEIQVTLDAQPAEMPMLSEAAIAEALIGLLQPRDGQSADTWIIRALVEKVTLFTDSVRVMYTTREIDGIDPKPESLENTALQPAENDGSFLNILGTPSRNRTCN